MQVARTQDEEMLAKQAYLRALLGQWVLVPQELKEEEAADAEEGGGGCHALAAAEGSAASTDDVEQGGCQ